MQLILFDFSLSWLVSKHLLSALASVALPETTPFGICVLSFSVVSCKISANHNGYVSLGGVFWVHFVCLFPLGRDEDTEGALGL